MMDFIEYESSSKSTKWLQKITVPLLTILYFLWSVFIATLFQKYLRYEYAFEQPDIGLCNIIFFPAYAFLQFMLPITLLKLFIGLVLMAARFIWSCRIHDFHCP